MEALTRDTLQAWLDEADINHYLCPDCDGLHLSDTEQRLGVLEARLLLEPDLLSLLTEIAIRPSAVLPIQGSLHLINLDNPMVKCLVNLIDDDIPRLLISACLPPGGLTEPYFLQWFSRVLDETHSIVEHASQMDVLYLEQSEFDGPDSDAIH